jgi:hypothetical protein
VSQMHHSPGIVVLGGLKRAISLNLLWNGVIAHRCAHL